MQFNPGSDVIYGFHGRCSVQGIEEKTIGGETVAFYRLQIERAPLAKANSKKGETQIWIPVSAAAKQGLRAVVSKDQCQELFEIFANGEYYYPLEEKWQLIKPTLEKAIMTEGAAGSAKVLSYLYTLIHSHVVPPADVVKFEETVRRPFLRELSEVLGEPIVNLEEQINKSMKAKLRPDN